VRRSGVLRLIGHHVVMFKHAVYPASDLRRDGCPQSEGKN
jgi:hypothetical protein